MAYAPDSDSTPVHSGSPPPTGPNAPAVPAPATTATTPDRSARRRKTLLAVAACAALALAAGAVYEFAPGGGSDDRAKAAQPQADGSPGTDSTRSTETGGTTPGGDGKDAGSGPEGTEGPDATKSPGGEQDSGPSTGPTGPSDEPPEPDPTVNGTVQLSDGWHVNLDADPLKPARSGASNRNEIDFRYHSGRFRTRDGNRLALLAAHRDGSLGICRKQVTFTKNIDVDQVGPGRQICVFTRDGHTALVTLRKPAPADRATFTLAVWRDTASQP